MDKWTELRTAYLVAKLGTVSEAANVLDVHRATVNRHIEALEETLGTKLFQRHSRGYTPTDAGRDMFETAGRVEEMFSELAGRTQGRKSQLSGELILTALTEVAPLVMPAMAQFRQAYPDVLLTFIAESRLARLEYGEAHIALRAGPKPKELDYVVQLFQQVRFGLYAHESYVLVHGCPRNVDELREHWFVGSHNQEVREPYADWIRAYIPATKLALDAQHPSVVLQSILAGLGIGFLEEQNAVMYDDLIQVFPPQEDWIARLWIVTHVDIHRIAKVQEFIRFLKNN